MSEPIDDTLGSAQPSVLAAATSYEGDDATHYLRTLLRHAPRAEREAALREIADAWPTLDAAQLRSLGWSTLFRDLAVGADAEIRVALAAGFASVADDLGATHDAALAARASGMLHLLTPVGFVGDVAAHSLEIVVAGSTPLDLYGVSGPLAAWLSERASDSPALVRLALALDVRNVASELLGVCAWLEPSSARMAWAAHAAASSVHSACIETYVVYAEVRDGVAEVEQPPAGIEAAVRRHPTTPHVLRALREKPDLAADGIDLAHLRAVDPVAQGVLRAWLWMAEQEREGGG